jgi:bifunctional non-homologous end joining protein LigD
MPTIIYPQLAALAEEPPEGDGWLHEIKLDGYRVLARVENKKTILYTRRGNDWTGTFAPIAKAVSGLPADTLWLDGEVVAMLPDGTSSFQDLQDALSMGRTAELSYYIFDLMYLDGQDLRDVPLIDRKKILEGLLGSEAKPVGPLFYSDHVRGSGRAFFDNACKFRLEGIMSKAAGSVYVSARAKTWLKIKCALRQEFVIGGYTEPGGSRTGFGALLLGVYDSEGRLRFKGRVGTGFNQTMLEEISARLRKLKIKDPPFIDPPSGTGAKGVNWVKPEMVGEVRFTEWTNDGILRQPAFLGLRKDKPPNQVVLESPEPAVEAHNENKTDSAAAPPAGKEPGGVYLTNANRVLYPAQGLTKGDLWQYYKLVGKLIIPHVAGRPLTLVRCPDGRHEDCFFQKHANETVPKVLDTIQVKEGGGAESYMVVDSMTGLAALVQMGVLEIHTWNSRKEKLEYPDRFVMDIDPDPSVAWEKVAEAALLIRERLGELGLTSFLKTTGGKGLHVVVPLSAKENWDEVKAFTKALAEDIVRRAPDSFTSKMTKAKRLGRIFVDYMRNIRGATAVEVYSTRAKDGAPVSAPIGWDELADGVRSDAFNIRNMPDRIKKLKRDPWEGFFGIRQSITKTAKKKLGMD